MSKQILRLSAPVLAAFCLVLAPVFGAAQGLVQRGPIIMKEEHHDTSALPARVMGAMNPVSNTTFILPARSARPAENNPLVHPDPVLQQTYGPTLSTSKILSFDGISADGVAPPDTNLSVGDNVTNQAVEVVNVKYAVYNKTTGALISGPNTLASIFSGFGGLCQTGNTSDPTVQFDKMANRWVVSYVAYNNSLSSFLTCHAVSTTDDATGSYNRYSLSFGTVLADYPKVSVWPDAYYLTVNQFPNALFFTGAETCALNRTAMLAGGTMTAQCFKENTTVFSLMPSDLDGSTPPATGEPAFELEIGPAANQLTLWQFHVDFSNPANSTFTQTATLSTSAFSEACGGNSACIPQPSPGENLDSLGDRLMYRLAYRNFGTFESMVVTHSITPSSGTAKSAVRWYEIRSPQSSPVIFQSGTISSNAASLWMGSAAEDKNNDIGVGFSASSSKIKPSAVYTGRLATDPVNTMESLGIVVKGTGVQEATQNRWGDYSSMAIDPGDDCTLWYAQEYIKTTGSFNWSTRLFAFRFTGCP